MRKAAFNLFSLMSLMFSFLFFPGLAVNGQESAEKTPSLPDDINKIVTFSCMPCHSSTGGMLSRGKLNFTDWTNYSLETQKKKAGKMYSELKKGAMPPKNARETRPDIIPTKEQIEIIKKWSESFVSVEK